MSYNTQIVAFALHNFLRQNQFKGKLENKSNILNILATEKNVNYVKQLRRNKAITKRFSIKMYPENFYKIHRKAAAMASQNKILKKEAIEGTIP